MPTLIRPRKLRTDKEPLSEQSWKQLRAFDALSEAPDTATNLSLRQLRNPLSKVPRSQRGVEWTERVVIAYCIKQQRSPRVRSLRRRIIGYWEENGKPENAQDFAMRVERALLAGDPSQKSFFLHFETRDGAETAKELHDVLTTLKELGLNVFLNSGTLLGAVRDQTFIKHDDDMDIGVIVNSTQPLDVADELIALHKVLKAKLDLPIKTSFNSPVLKIKLASDIVLDIFPTWFQDGKVYIWPHTFGELTKADLLPLKTISMHGYEMPVPAEPEKMLALNYGEQWKVPDAGFSFPWAEAKIRHKILLERYRSKVKWYAFFSYFKRG